MGKKGLGGGMTDAVFGTREADAARSIALSQQGQAQRSYDELKSGLSTARGQMDTATTQGLISLDRDIANQEKNLARQEKLISQLDPTIIEASQQALKLLRGERSSTLAPVEQQRQLQRQKLVDSLREQLGPGAETSTAGIQALTRFDQETSSLLSGAQQQALQGLGSLSAQFTSQRPDMLREIMGLGDLGMKQYGLRADQANFGAQSASTLFGASQPLTQMAGAERTGELIQGQRNSQRLNAWLDSSLAFGEAFGGMGMGKFGGGGGSKGGQTPGLTASQDLKQPELGSSWRSQ